jgi:hypothetical protein
MRRLFSCFISCNYHDKDRDSTDGFKIVRKADVWWHPHNAEQSGLWKSTLMLSEEFFEEIMAAPIPVDLKALKALRRSPMQLDLYMWLTYRNSYLKAETAISWDQLRMQFGAEYARSDNFKAAFKDALKKVLVVYPSAKIQTVDAGILIAPSATHISKRGKTLPIR